VRGLPQESHEASGENPEVLFPDALWLLFFGGSEARRTINHLATQRSWSWGKSPRRL